MVFKEGVKAVIFDIKENKPVYLLLHRVLNWKGWEFPKGGIEKGEDEREALLREVKEETGLKNLKIVKKLNIIKYRGGNGAQYIYHQYLVKGDRNEKVVLQKVPVVEHDDYRWVGFREAHDLLTWLNDKETLKKADDVVHELMKNGG